MTFTKTFHGFVEDTTDTLLIVEACRNGILPIVNRRPIDKERNSIKSGTIIVFDESESGIKRWTDGILWSPSRILGSFLVYRELANRENRKSAAIEDDETCMQQQETEWRQRERALVGSLTTSNTTYNFKENGLIKKTIRIMVNGNYFHIVNYYTKHDVFNRLLPTPSTSPELASLHIPSDIISHLHSPHPPIGHDQFYARKRINHEDTALIEEDNKAIKRPFIVDYYRSSKELPPMQNHIPFYGVTTNRYMSSSQYTIKE